MNMKGKGVPYTLKIEFEIFIFAGGTHIPTVQCFHGVNFFFYPILDYPKYWQITLNAEMIKK